MAGIQFSGLASGIDSASLIDALVEARKVVNVKRQADIDFLNSETDALEELNTKILALNDLVDQFRSANGGGIVKKASSSDATIATAVAGSTAINSSFAITVNNLAQVANASFNESYNAATDYVSTAGSGNVTIEVGTGSNKKTITAAVTKDSTTIGEFVDAINNNANASGRLSASIINAGTDSSPDYRIMLTSLKQGVDEGQMAIAVDPAITELQTNTLNASTNAKNASISVSGISGAIQRSSNSIDDIVPGVTVRLLKEGSTIVSVNDDADNTLDLMNQIVDAFNEIVKYVNENDTIERTETETSIRLTFGTLAKTNIDTDFLSAFRLAMAGADTDNGTNITTMSEMGITTNRDGTLELDEDDFKQAISDDSIGASELITSFADSVAGPNGFIYEYTKYKGIIDTAQDTNNTEIKSLNETINNTNRMLEKYRSSLVMQYSQLEITVAKLQNQGASLSSALSGLK